MNALQNFNTAISSLIAENQVWSETDPSSPLASPALINHILEQSYARTVAPHSHLLRAYEGFSNQVYGEIKPLFTSEIIKNTSLSSSSIFLDLGSGTGNVVLQVAAQVCPKASYGIEIMPHPSSLAKKQRAEFCSRMHMYGKPLGRIFLKQGDFLEDEGIQTVIAKSDVIFVNK